MPVNENGGLHGLVALPVFLAQPTALLLTAISLRAARPALARLTLVVAGLSAAGVIGFAAILLVDGSAALGGFERLALWPGYVWVGVIAVVSRTLVRRAPAVTTGAAACAASSRASRP